MPELPEIETVKMQLARVLLGQALAGVDVLANKIVRGDLKVLVGKKVEGVERMGKVLLIDFGSGLKLGFHFKMTGQLIYDDGKTRVAGGHPTEDFNRKMPSSHTRAIFTFDKGKLFFNDQRLFGWIEINPKFVDKLGPEPFEITAEEFAIRIGKTRRPIKIAIMDQEIISGVGNIYANDALWEAGIDPSTPSNKLSAEKLELLLEKISLVLREGIKFGGATASDSKYISLHGLGGHYQDHFRVYDRGGKDCLTCGAKIERITLGGRGTFFCPKCQK
jgi:formamidopyrimidine-DNA glycosylase